MTGSSRRGDYILAAVLAGIAFVISPLGIELITGRVDLSFRATAISLGVLAFLLSLLAAVLARGWLRRLFFYSLAVTLPMAVFAGMEAAAIWIDLANRVAPLEEISLLANKRPWPKYLLNEAARYTTPEGIVLYRPWQGDGISFNALGLRTSMPTPKVPGEWRVAITGGSAAFGWRLVDADTLAARVQDVLRRTGHNNVTVYNFGIAGATLKRELALLKHFRDTYALDQALFYTGANDVMVSYLDAPNRRFGPWLGATGSFELIRTVVRLQAIWSAPSPQLLQWIDSEVLPAALKSDPLGQGIAEADRYCREVKLSCDFILQPMMFFRKSHSGAEARMEKTLARVYPLVDRLAATMYRDALAAGPPGHVVDLTHIFDDSSEPFFLDHIHINEAGNRIAAERVAATVSVRPP